MDYLRGHFPDSVNHKDQTFSIKFPTIKSELDTENEKKIKNENATDNNTSSTESKISTAIEKIDKNVSDCIIKVPTGGNMFQILKKSENVTLDSEEKVLQLFSSFGKNVPKNQELVLLSVVRAIDGLKSSQEERLRVVVLRVQCLLIMSHSRLTNDLLQPYLRIGSTVLRDLISLSDISSEPFAELLLENSSLSAIPLILKCTLGLLEFNLRRRGPLLEGILTELGLSKNGKYRKNNSNATVFLIQRKKKIRYVKSYTRNTKNLKICLQYYIL